MREGGQRGRGEGGRERGEREKGEGGEKGRREGVVCV
jgi:hypothetical protein